MIYRLFLIYLILVTFLGCAYAPKTDLDTFTNLHTRYSKCNKIPGKIAMVYNYDFDLEHLRFAEIVGKDGADRRKDFDAKILLREIEKVGVVEINQDANPKYIFGFSWYVEYDYFLLPWLSALTFGVLPIKQNGEIWMKVRVFDPNGKFLYDKNSVKLEHSLYGGWLAFMFGYIGTLKKESDFYEKAMPIMINDLIDEMVNSNILDCKKG